MAGMDRTLTNVFQDVRYAARVLRREPVFALAAIVSLALGIAASTAVFSIADTIFLRPLPYAEPDRLVWVAIRFPGFDLGDFVPSPDYVAWRRDNRVFQDLAAMPATPNRRTLLGGADPAEVNAGYVSANFLDVFATRPALGRTFSAAEELPNGPKAVVLTDRFWREHFHARRDILGLVVTLDAQPYSVIGVLPPSFIYPVDVKIDLLTTLPVLPTASHRDNGMYIWSVFGRLKRGTTVEQARADLNRLFAASKADAPQMFRGDTSVVLQTLQEHRVGDARTLLFILMAAAGCLLAIACANVGNLLLVRWSSRSQELAVRAAIGAGRGRLARQLFTEIALLIAAGTVSALILAAGALRAFVYYAAGALPRLSEVSMDLRVFGVGLLVSVVTALIFGGLPALRSGRVDLQSLVQGGRSSAGDGFRLMRRALVVAEVALSVILLAGSALLLETLWHLQNDHLGFQPEHVLSVSVPLRGAKYAGPEREVLAEDVLNFLRRIPGTEAAALTQCTPLWTGIAFSTFTRSDRPIPEAWHRGESAGICGVGPDYLKAAGGRVVQGRFLSEGDFLHPNTVAVINEAAAQAYFSGESALGKQVLGGHAGETWKTVVGVVADTKNQGLAHTAVPEAFVNVTRRGEHDSADLLFLVRTLAGEGLLARALQERGLFTKIQSMDDAIGELTAPPRFNTILVSTFALIAFLMAVLGVYGVLAFSVAQRRQEIGIRMALGATPGSVLALVMKEGALLLGLGTVAGVACALGLTRYLATLLYGVSATDARTFVIVVIGLGLANGGGEFLAGAAGGWVGSDGCAAARMNAPADSLWLLFSEDINPGAPFAFFRAHRCNHAPVATSFKLV
jgi:putative ABC transport system permease protein